MTEPDNLRDRIAYAIAQADGDPPGMEPASCDYEMADAVIRELGLTRVTRSERVPKHRYVTEWIGNAVRTATDD